MDAGGRGKKDEELKWLDLDPDVQGQVADELGLYVYMLVDPRDGLPFYVGKGRGTRFAAHGWEAMLKPDIDGDNKSSDEDSRKVHKIRTIRESGGEPEIWILRYGMQSEAEYTAVEAACIDLLRSMPIRPLDPGEARLPHGVKEALTNARTEKARGRGIVLLRDLVDDLAAPQLTYDKPLLIIRLGPWTDTAEDPELMPDGLARKGYGYKWEWLPSRERVQHLKEIGDSACGWWKINPDSVEDRGIEYFVAVHRGVTRGLFRIVPDSWQTKDYGAYPSGRRDRRRACRFEIVDSGGDFDAIVGEHGHRVKGIRQNSFYWPFKKS